jgi:hypothetical protein
MSIKQIKSMIGSAFLLPWYQKNQVVFCTIIFLFVMLFSVFTTIYFLQQGNPLSLLWLVLPFVFAPLFYLFYLPVRWKMDRLRSSLPADALLQSDCLIVQGIVQSPGIAQIRGEELVLTPLIGTPVVLPLAEVKIIKESCWFNGSYYPEQSGLWLQPVQSGQGRLGFALPNGEAWKAYFDLSLLKEKENPAG